MATQGPAPVDVGATTLVVNRPIDRSPTPVAPGPGTTGQIPTVPNPIGPPESAPPSVTPGPGTGQTTSPIPSVTPPVTEQPVELPTNNASNNVVPTVPNLIEVLSDGTIVVKDAAALNFTGTGVTVTGNGSVAVIDISGGGGGGNTGNVTFDNVNIIGTGNLKLQPDPDTAGAYLDVYLTTGPDIHIASTDNNLILGRDAGANVTVGIDGNVRIQAASGNAHTWTFGTNSDLTFPIGNSKIRNGYPGPAGGSGDGSSWFVTGDGGGVASPDGKQYIQVDNVGLFIGTNYTGNTGYEWTFGTNGVLSATGNITTTANISGAYFIGNGSQLTGIAASYGNANVAANLAAFGTNPVSTTGNITGGNINTAGVVSATSNITGGNITTAGVLKISGASSYIDVAGTGFIQNAGTGELQISSVASKPVIINANAGAYGWSFGTAGNLTLPNGGTLIGTGNITGGNILTGGLISATGNVTGNFFIGNGSQLTGITAVSTYGNANVVANLAALGSNPISTTGNITGGNILFGIFQLLNNGDAQVGNLTVSNGPGVGNLVVGNIISATGNILTGGNISATANITGGNISATNHTGTTVSVTGNITGGNILAGSGVISTGGNVNGATFNGSVAFATGTVSGTGNITGGNIAVSGVLLSTNTVSATGNVTGGNINTGGNISTTGNVIALDVRVGPGITGGTISALGNITSANTLNGAGLSLSGNIVSALVSAANITTTANISGGNILGTHVGNVTGTTVSVTGNITGGNLNAAGLSLSSNVVSTLNVTANVAGGNITTPGLISATGNITGGNLTTGALTSTASLSVTGNTATITSANYSIGYLNIPQVSLAANATAALTDSGKHFYSTTAGNLQITIPDNANVAFPVGTALSLVVQAAGNVLVVTQAGTTLYFAGNSTAGNRVVSTYGMATIMKVATNTWFINGTGVT